MSFSDFELNTAKFLSSSISSTELDALHKAMENEVNHNVFKSFTEIEFVTRHLMSKYDKEAAKKNLLKKIKSDKREVKVLFIKRLLNYAAIILLGLGLGYFYWNHNFANSTKIKLQNLEDEITLTLSDGSVKTISEASEASVYNHKGDRVGLQQGNQLVYKKGNTAEELIYNTLTVPYGKKFALVLSDGTKVHLNSGSSIKYPVEFKNNHERKIQLIGEGYFDVAKNESPFVITANHLNVRVLGTQFNLSAYPEDETVRTVLVEGSVGFFEESKKFTSESPVLYPGYMAIWERNIKTMEFKEVNTELYTDWMNGRIIFSHMPFEDILKKLERIYNVEITNSYEQLNQVKFNASFDTETINQIFEAFNKNYPLKFTIDGRKIEITQP